MPISIRIHGVKTLNKVKTKPKGQWVLIQLYNEIPVHEIINSFMDHWEGNVDIPGDTYKQVKSIVSKIVLEEYSKDLHSKPFKNIDCTGKYLYLDVE